MDGERRKWEGEEEGGVEGRGWGGVSIIVFFIINTYQGLSNTCLLRLTD